MANPDIKDQGAPPVATQHEVQEDARKLVSARDIASEWWALFRSHQLSEHVNRAFKANPDIQTAQAILRRAQEHPVVQQGFLYSSDAAGNMPQSDTPGQQAPAKYYYNLHTSRLAVGYVPEVLVASREPAASQSQVEAQQEAVYFTLSSNAIVAAIQEASLRAQIEAQLNIIGLNRQALEIVHNQFKLGYVSESDVTLRELDAARAQHALVPLQQLLEQTRDLMRMLAGNLPDPDADAEDAFALDDLRLSKDLPLSLSSVLVLQRPDVRAAETQLRSVAEQNGLEIVNAMPKFTITGATGGAAFTPAWMLRDGGRFFDANGNIAQYIFGAKEYRAQSRAVQQVLSRVATQYRNTVMVALQNVADALNAIQVDTRALDVAAEAEQSASKNGDQVRKNYEAGAVDFPALKVAEQNEQFANMNLVRAQANQLADAVALFHTLGGRWWKREETDKAVVKQP